MIKDNIFTELNNRAHCELILSEGEDVYLPEPSSRYISLRRLLSRSHICEYMVESKHDRKIEVELNCSESQGYNFTPKSGKAVRLLDSGQRELIMKLIPMEKVESKDLILK